MKKLTITLIVFIYVLNPVFGQSLLKSGTEILLKKRSPSSKPNHLYEYLGTGPTKLIRFKVTKAGRVNIKEKNGVYFIKKASGSGFGLSHVNDTINQNTRPPDVKTYKGKLYFPEGEDENANGNLNAPVLRTFNIQHVFQTLTIPFKIQPHLEGELKDTFQTQVNSGVNFGFSYGFKFSLNKYLSKKNAFGLSKRQVSLTVGGLFGLGTASLSDANTRPKLDFDRKALVITPGIYGLLGFGRFNVGYALGWDWATGPKSADWVYHGRRWHGLDLALDVIK